MTIGIAKPNWPHRAKDLKPLDESRCAALVAERQVVADSRLPLAELGETRGVPNGCPTAVARARALRTVGGMIEEGVSAPAA